MLSKLCNKYTLVHSFKTKESYDNWKRQQNHSWSIQKSNLLNCTLCRASSHKMRMALATCNNENCNESEPCSRQYKINTCLKKEKIEFYSRGEHRSANLKQKQHGMTSIVKELIEYLIYNYDSHKP